MVEAFLVGDIGNGHVRRVGARLNDTWRYAAEGYTSEADVHDLIALVRYGRQPGEPGRPLIRQGPITWALQNGSQP